MPRQGENHACQNPNILDTGERALEPSGPVWGASSLLLTWIVFPWGKSPTCGHRNPLSKSRVLRLQSYLALQKPEGIWGQEIFIIQMFLELCQETVPCGGMSPTTCTWPVLVSTLQGGTTSLLEQCPKTHRQPEQAPASF